MKLLRFALLVIVALTASRTAEGQTALRISLREARAMAVQRHPLVHSAELNAQAADQVPRQVGAAKYPVVQVHTTGVGALENSQITAGGMSNSSVSTRAAAGVSVSQTLTDFGRTDSLVESSRLRARSVEQTATATRAQVVLQVDRAYFAVLRAQSMLRVAEQTVAARLVVVEQIEALQRSGVKSGLDVSFAQYGLSEAELLRSRSENDLQAAYTELSLAIGSRDEHTFELVEDPLPVEPLASRFDLIEPALANRPELKALRFDRDAANRFLEAEKKLDNPTVSTTLNAGWAPFRADDLSRRYGAVAINVTIPIFNGRLFEARESEAELKARAAEALVKEAENRVARDVRAAWFNADSAFQRISLASQLLGHARESLELAQERYRLGLSSIVELSQALLSVTLAEIEHENAKYEYLVRRSILDYHRGMLP